MAEFVHSSVRLDRCILPVGVSRENILAPVKAQGDTRIKQCNQKVLIPESDIRALVPYSNSLCLVRVEPLNTSHLRAMSFFHVFVFR